MDPSSRSWCLGPLLVPTRRNENTKGADLQIRYLIYSLELASKLADESGERVLQCSACKIRCRHQAAAWPSLPLPSLPLPPPDPPSPWPARPPHLSCRRGQDVLGPGLWWLLPA